MSSSSKKTKTIRIRRENSNDAGAPPNPQHREEAKRRPWSAVILAIDNDIDSFQLLSSANRYLKQYVVLQVVDKKAF